MKIRSADERICVRPDRANVFSFPPNGQIRRPFMKGSLPKLCSSGTAVGRAGTGIPPLANPDSRQVASSAIATDRTQGIGLVIARAKTQRLHKKRIGFAVLESPFPFAYSNPEYSFCLLSTFTWTRADWQNARRFLRQPITQSGLVLALV